VRQCNERAEFDSASRFLSLPAAGSKIGCWLSVSCIRQGKARYGYARMCVPYVPYLMYVRPRRTGCACVVLSNLLVLCVSDWMDLRMRDEAFLYVPLVAVTADKGPGSRRRETRRGKRRPGRLCGHKSSLIETRREVFSSPWMQSE
jgi:hypothetical protein